MSEITSAEEGDYVSVNVWAEGVTVVSVTLDGNPVDNTGGAWYSFTMPGHDVNIVITCE